MTEDEWLTHTSPEAMISSTVREMAASVYESREFGVLPVLADALQDAGCESDPIPCPTSAARGRTPAGAGSST